MEEKKEDFTVIIASETDNGTVVATTVDELTDEKLFAAIQSYDSSNNKYSIYLQDGSSPSDTITPTYIDELANNLQNNLKNIQTVNAISRKYINRNDIVGKTYESIETNINTKAKVEYDTVVGGRNKNKKLENVKTYITNFNKEINLKSLVRKSISTTWAEGTYISYLRKQGDSYIVDYYPLGVCEISDYDVNGEPVVLFNISELRSRLQKTYRKNKKRQPLFFDKIEDEVQANYPPEVYQAFKEKESFAKLDVNRTGVIRIGNMNRKYGVTPIFRALEPLSMLETFDNSDRVNSKAKSKKILHQKLRKEVLGTDFNKKGFGEMSYSHENLMKAWKQPTVVVTTPAYVESLLYVEPKVELTDINTVNNYRSRVLSTLGISYLMDSSSSVSTANISVTQLMRTINTISEQLEFILQKWYKLVIEENGMDIAYCPTIKIIDSEQLEFDIKKDLAELLFCKFNTSYETAFEILGLSVEDEKQKRIKENDEKLHETFFARETAYTSSGKGDNTGNPLGGRPKGDETDKQIYDETYTENVR